jgi:hypothetical protein
LEILGIGDHKKKHEAEYETCTDGRLQLKKGWKKFVSEFNLKVGFVVLILFNMESCGFVSICFDVMYLS